LSLNINLNRPNLKVTQNSSIELKNGNQFLPMMGKKEKSLGINPKAFKKFGKPSERVAIIGRDRKWKKAH